MTRRSLSAHNTLSFFKHLQCLFGMQFPSFPEGSLLNQEAQIHHFSTALWNLLGPSVTVKSKVTTMRPRSRDVYSYTPMQRYNSQLQASCAGVCRWSWGNGERLWRWVRVFYQCQLKYSSNFMPCFMLYSAYWDPSRSFQKYWSRGLPFLALGEHMGG